MLRTGCRIGNHQWFLQQRRRTRRRRVQTTGWAQQKEAGGNGQLGTVLSPKALAPTRRPTTKVERERNAPEVSYRQEAKQQGTHWLTPTSQCFPVPPALSMECHPGTHAPSLGDPPGWQNNTALSKDFQGCLPTPGPLAAPVPCSHHGAQSVGPWHGAGIIPLNSLRCLIKAT